MPNLFRHLIVQGIISYLQIMKGYIYIDDNLIGEAFFKVIDESMGVVGGELIPSMLYDKYKSQLQFFMKNMV
jgi:hypothetical protein